MDKKLIESYEYNKATNDLFNLIVKDVEKNSTEAFFNKETSAIAIALHEFVSELKNFWDMYFINDDRNHNWDLIKKKIKEIKSIVEQHEMKIAKVLNCESVTIGLSYYTGAACYPLFFDKEIISINEEARKKKDKLDLNIDFVKKIEDIIETKSGFKFKKSDGIKLIYIFGLSNFYNNLTIEECVAILLHETGHAMQQMLVSSAMNIYCHAKATYIENLSNGLSGGTFNVFDMIFSKRNEKKKTDEELAKPHLSPYEEYDREKFKDETKTITDENLKIIFEYRDKILKKENPFFKFIADTIFHIFDLTIHLIRVPFMLIYFFNISFHKDFLKKNVRFEQFADYMAVQNGYGSEIVSSLAKLENIDSGVMSDYGVFNLVYLIPILNILLTYMDYRDMKDNLLISGYPTNLQRYEAVYKSMKYELENNKSLSSVDKEILKQDMEKVDSIYKSQLNRKGLHYFLFNLAAKITRKAVDSPKAGANIEENVLIPFNEAINEYKKENKI